MAAGSLSTVARATTRPCSSRTQMAVSFTETSSPTKCCMAASLSLLGWAPILPQAKRRKRCPEYPI